MKHSRAVGAAYETQAAQYLEARGYRIRDRNFRCRMGQIPVRDTDGRAAGGSELPQTAKDMPDGGVLLPYA